MSDVTTTRRTMGVDLGDKYSYFCLIEDREVIEEGRIGTSPDIFGKFFSTRKPMMVAIEAGTHSPWASRTVSELGHKVLVANPRKVRSIYQNRSKNDRVDAEQLARLAHADPKLLCPIQHRGNDAQTDLAILRERGVLVTTRTKLVNSVRGVVKTTGRRIPACSAKSFAKHAPSYVPKSVWPAVSPVIDMIGEITQRIRRLDRMVEELADKKYPETAVLRGIPGVGALTALAFVLIVEDPRRFADSRGVGSFFGLCPAQDESGDMRRELRITKCGNPLMRKLLVGSAQYILGPFGRDNDLRRWGQKLARRGGKHAKKRAAIAVARKLAILMHHLWLTQEPYVALRQSPVQADAP
jgi:transposase